MIQPELLKVPEKHELLLIFRPKLEFPEMEPLELNVNVPPEPKPAQTNIPKAEPEIVPVFRKSLRPLVLSYWTLAPNEPAPAMTPVLAKLAPPQALSERRSRPLLLLEIDPLLANPIGPLWLSKRTNAPLPLPPRMTPELASEVDPQLLLTTRFKPSVEP